MNDCTTPRNRVSGSASDPHGLLQPFREMGRELHGSWRATGFRPGAFPCLAQEALAASRLLEETSPDDILRWVLESESLPEQVDIAGKFGEPPVTLYTDDRVSVSALFWVEADTSLHQHGFSGAFGILRGSSLHSTFAFEERELVCEAMRHGSIHAQGVELLRQGDVRPILAGRALIHALYHLERPTVSLVVRTQREQIEAIQYDYHRPGIAIDPFFDPPSLKRATQAVATMLRLEHPSLPEWLRAFFERADPFSAYRMLLTIDGSELGRRLIADTLGILRRRFEDLGEGMAQALFAMRSKNNLLDLRGRVEEADLRYMLALLINVEGRDAILAMLRARHPDRDPVDVALTALARLLPLDDKAERTAGPAALPFVRQILSGKSIDSLLHPAVRNGLPPREVARLALILPSLSLFRGLMKDAGG